jgi:two-component system nitrogen regulation response regulator GlnG
MRGEAAGETESDWTRRLRQTVQQRLKLGEQDILQALGSDFERVLLTATLQYTDGHKQEAAKRLGWGRNTLTRKLRELGIDQA